MALLGTTYEDPYFYQKRMAQLGQTLGAVSDRWRQRKEERHARDLAEIDRLMEYMGRFPELADSIGDQLKVRFKDFPEVGALVDVMRNRGSLARQIPEAGQRWQAERQDLEADYAKRTAQAQAMPDAVPLPTPMGGFVPFPNLQKVTAQQEISKINPDLFPSQALSRLSPTTRDMARVWASRSGVPIFEPSPFDPNADLPENVRAIYNLERLPPEAQKAARVNARLEESPATIASEKYRTSEREAQTEQRQAERQKREAFEREMEDLRQQHHLTRISAARAGRGKAKETDAEKQAKKEGLDWKSIQNLGSANVKEYDAQLRAEMEGLHIDEKKNAKETYAKAHGKRPPAIPEGVARKIAAGAQARVDAGELTPDQARDEVAIFVRRWQELSQKFGNARTMQFLAREQRKPVAPAQKAPEAEPAPPASAIAALEGKYGPLPAQIQEEISRRLNAKESVSSIEAALLRDNPWLRKRVKKGR